MMSRYVFCLREGKKVEIARAAEGINLGVKTPAKPEKAVQPRMDTNETLLGGPFRRFLISSIVGSNLIHQS